MNKRIIKELGRQAMSDVMNGSDPYGDADKMYIPAEFMEKFAQLIVQECVSVGRTAFLNDHSTVPVFPAEKIKEHFGVEE